MTGLVAVIMVFTIPIVAIITDHFQKQSKIQRDILKDQLELEKLKHENYVIETERLKLELKQIELHDVKDESNLFIK
ncbi:hypothetical protein [Domibacillus aminovorans]|uniref:Uncharacterized protein n=1 Tax=Domibacillus aminovorans TaxID=29332 RepID=A0A177LA08_9BACI|nr:hypothetical protein [Domibacillus aminovorans]OAH62324.1 hypothetical protein AWH49_10590 [Domibacillus aminovorans]